MIILHVAPITWHEVGGLRMSIPALVESQNRLDGVQAALAVSASHPGEAPESDFPLFHRKIKLAGGDRLDLPAPFDRPGLVVFHSTYIAAHAAMAARLRKAAIPYVICPRGGMTRYAQTFRRWKKWLANRLFFNKMVARAAAVNCLTDGEAEASVDWKRPMFVTGNGIELPSPFALAKPGRSARRRLVFIGRLHIQYKGLDMLLQACHLARAHLQRAEAKVEICGPDCCGSRLKLSNRIAKLKLENLVSLYGPVTGEAKAALLRQTDVFLHPSRSEGHPMAVLEALAHGLPCLLTPVTNMAREVAQAGAGFSVEASPAGIAAGLEEAVTVDAAWLSQAGANARRLAMKEYSWDKTAAESIGAYRRCAA